MGNFHEKFKVSNIQIQGDVINIDEINNLKNKNIFFIDKKVIKKYLGKLFNFKKL